MDFFVYFFEINLIKELGYDTNLVEHLSKNKDNKALFKIKIDGYIYEIPNFLILKKIPDDYNNSLIRKSLYFTRQVLQNNFLFQITFCFQSLE